MSEDSSYYGGRNRSPIPLVLFTIRGICEHLQISRLLDGVYTCHFYLLHPLFLELLIYFSFHLHIIWLTKSTGNIWSVVGQKEKPQQWDWRGAMAAEEPALQSPHPCPQRVIKQLHTQPARHKQDTLLPQVTTWLTLHALIYLQGIKS